MERHSLKMEPNCLEGLPAGDVDGVRLAQCTNTNCVKKYKAKQERKHPTNDQGQQHLNMVTNHKIESTTYHQDNSDKEYCGYDIGADFHQGDTTIKQQSQ